MAHLGSTSWTPPVFLVQDLYPESVSDVLGVWLGCPPQGLTFLLPASPCGQVQGLPRPLPGFAQQ